MAGIVLTAGMLGYTLVRSGPSHVTAPQVAEVSATTGEVSAESETARGREALRVLPGSIVMEGDAQPNDLLAVLEPWANTAGQRWLARVNARTGEIEWRNAIDANLAPHAIIRTIVGDAVVVATPTQLLAFDAQSGHIRWKRGLGSAPLNLCSAKAGLGVIDAANRVSIYSLATGFPTLNGQCAATYSSNFGAPNFTPTDATGAAPWLPKRTSFVAQRALLPLHGTAQVFIGLDKNPSSPQDRVPALGVASGRKWLWQADLASSVGETARWLDPPLAVVRSDTLVVPYVTTEGAKLAAFTLPTGKLVWAQALPKVAVDDTGGVGSQRTAPELSISLARRIFYRTQEGRLWVLNLDSGILEWSLGDQ